MNSNEIQQRLTTLLSNISNNQLLNQIIQNYYLFIENKDE